MAQSQQKVGWEVSTNGLSPQEARIAQPVGNINVDQSVGENPVVGNKDKSLTQKIQENTNEVSCREKIESNNPALTVGDADKVSKSSFVSSCEQTRSNALSSTSTTVNNTEKDQKDENNLEEGTTSVGSKGSDKVASDIKTDI